MKVKDLKPTLMELKKHEKGFKFTYDAVGEALGTTGQNIGKRARTGSSLTTDEIEKIEKYFNVKLLSYNASKLPQKLKKFVNYLASDEITKHNMDIAEFKKNNRLTIQDDLDDLSYTGTTSKMLEDATDFIRVPYYPELNASCGPGGFAPLVSPTPEHFAISSKYGLSKRKNYFIINAFGDSMEKTIYDKEYIIFEDWKEKNNQIIDNKIYFFCYEGRLYIKRLIYNIHEIIVLSDNNVKDDSGELIYKPQIIKKDAMNDLQIYGKFKGKIEND